MNLTITLIACLWGSSVENRPLHGQEALQTVLKIERGGQGVPAAHAALATLAKSGLGLEETLKAAANANPVSKNWLLALAGSAVDRTGLEKSKPLLEKILADQSADGEVRYWVLDRLAGSDSALRELLLDGRTEDSSLDIRYEAIEQVGKKLPSVEAAKADEALKQQAIAGYQQLLKAARQHGQVNAIGGVLKELGVEVDMRQHFGFVSQWHVVGPFDNRQEVGFPVAYPPEVDFVRQGKLDMQAIYPGKNQGVKVAWQAASTDKPDGSVDLNPILLNEKGAVTYAYTTIQSPDERKCQVRFGTPNANKLWVNGQEVTGNNVYHTGSQIDQYVANTTLKRGTNTVLVKLCQNEQTEAWAQDYSFMLRFTDFTGLAIQLD